MESLTLPRYSDNLPTKRGIHEVETKQQFKGAHCCMSNHSRPPLLLRLSVVDQFFPTNNNDETIKVKKRKSCKINFLDLKPSSFEDNLKASSRKMLPMTDIAIKSRYPTSWNGDKKNCVVCQVLSRTLQEGNRVINMFKHFRAGCVGRPSIVIR